MELARPGEIAPPTSPGAEARRGAGRFPWPEILLAGAVLVHLLFLVSLRTGWFNPLFNDALHRFGPGCDFFSIYAAGVKARLGEPVYPIGGHVEQVPYAYAFRYAPIVAYTLGWLLSLFPHLTAYGLWLVACELALLRCLRLTLSPRRHGDTEGTRRGEEGKGFTAESLRTLSPAERDAEGEPSGDTVVASEIPGSDYALRNTHYEAGSNYALRNTHYETQDRSAALLTSAAPSRTRVAIAAAMWLCFTPYYLELYVGQFTFITASLVFWAYLAWESGSIQLSPRRGAEGTNLSQRRKDAKGKERAREGERDEKELPAAADGWTGHSVVSGIGPIASPLTSSPPAQPIADPHPIPGFAGQLLSSPSLRNLGVLCVSAVNSVRIRGDLYWALAVLLKMMPLLYLPIALLRRRWGAVVGTGVVLVGTSVLYFQRFPADWALFTATNGDPRPSWHAGNQGLMALLYALSGERTALYLQYRLAALALVGLALAWLFGKAFTAETQRTLRPAESEGEERGGTAEGRGQRREGRGQGAEGRGQKAGGRGQGAVSTGNSEPGTRNSQFVPRTFNLLTCQPVNPAPTSR